MDYKEIKGLTVNSVSSSPVTTKPLNLTFAQPIIKIIAGKGTSIFSTPYYSCWAPSASFIRHSSTANFFSTQLISVPRCLKTSSKKYLTPTQLPLLHFTNMLMRSGKKESVLRLVWDALHGLKLNNPTTVKGQDFSQMFKNLLTPYEPLFAYRIQRVAKSTRKNSRGKSGKYLILWKYVPVYKRLCVVLRWLLTDIRLGKGRTFALRCTQAFDTISHPPQTSTLHKLRKFNHLFVFKYLRKSLLTSLRTVRSQVTE